MLRSLLVICTIFVIFAELAPVSDNNNDTLELELESNITVVKLDKGLKFEAHSKFDSDNSTTSTQSEKGVDMIIHQIIHLYQKPQHPTSSSSEEIHDPSIVSGRAVRSVDKKGDQSMIEQDKKTTKATVAAAQKKKKTTTKKKKKVTTTTTTEKAPTLKKKPSMPEVICDVIRKSKLPFDLRALETKECNEIVEQKPSNSAPISPPMPTRKYIEMYDETNQYLDYYYF